MNDRGGYIGRFAPSPTGPLHAGSMVAALASWLDAKANRGQWLVRIEDVDTPRCIKGADQIILQQLADCGLRPDAPPVYQSQRGHLYQNALDRLIGDQLAYPCACSRQDIYSALTASGHSRERNGELVYPGTCREGLRGGKARSWRFLSTFLEPKTPLAQRVRLHNAIYLIASGGSEDVCWTDRRLGAQRQNVSSEVGDFVLKRADGLWAYQFAVVVDDAAQGVSHVVRGEDLADSSARQILLGRALAAPRLKYLHTPLVLAPNGEKLSKQNRAQAFDSSEPLRILETVGRALGIIAAAASVPEWLAWAVSQWQQLYPDADSNDFVTHPNAADAQ